MPPEEDARASLDPGFAQENWGLLAQQCVENLLKPLIVLTDQQPPLSHDLARLQEFAVKARDSPEVTPLPASRERLLALIGQLRDGLEAQLQPLC
jgi:HEPN domain-containing protein